MSLHPQALPEVPAQTVVVAKAAFRRGNRYMLRRDELGTFYTDLDFAHLFAVRGQPAETSWRLALVLGFQCIGGGDAKRVTCPQEYTSQKWSQTHDLTGVPVINTRFAPAACASCPVRQQCTRSKTGPRKMTLQHKAEHEALQARREFQTTTVFQQQYNARAGIEGTISQSVRRNRYSSCTLHRVGQNTFTPPPLYCRNQPVSHYRLYCTANTFIRRTTIVRTDSLSGLCCTGRCPMNDLHRERPAPRNTAT